MGNELRDRLFHLLQPGQGLELTVWKDESDEEGTTFHTVVRDRNVNNLLVIPPFATFRQFMDLLKPPIVVGGLYGDGDVPYVFYPLLQSVEKTNHQGFWLKIPYDMEVESLQARAFVRIKAALPVVVESDPELVATSVDVSGGGLLFASAKKFAEASTLQLQVKFQPNNPSVCVKAKVVASRENLRSKKEEEAFATACQFIEMTEQIQQRIVAECFRIELYQKKHLQK